MIWTYFVLILLTIAFVELTKGWLKGHGAKAIYAIVVAVVLSWLYGWYSGWAGGEPGAATVYGLVSGVLATGLYRVVWVFCPRRG